MRTGLPQLGLSTIVFIAFINNLSSNCERISIEILIYC